MDTKYFTEAMQEQGYSDFTALPPHEQSNIMRRAQVLKARDVIIGFAETFVEIIEKQQAETKIDILTRAQKYKGDK